jgi:hypothetical protein|tara:strand:+ start:966 stop:1574 length:609 start_codon:yes stop_codon:yes gene_type:complete
MSFEELLKQAGLGDYSQYFSQDPTKISSALGLKGEQATQFGQFFQPFGQEQFMAAQTEIGERAATRTGFLESNYQSGFQGLGQQLGQATRQIGQAAGQAGFSGAGSTAKQIAESRKVAGQSLQDIMQRRQEGLYGIEQQRGTEMAGLTGTLKNYLQGIFGRGERLYGLDPTGGGTMNPGESGYAGISGTGAQGTAGQLGQLT